MQTIASDKRLTHFREHLFRRYEDVAPDQVGNVDRWPMPEGIAEEPSSSIKLYEIHSEEEAIVDRENFVLLQNLRIRNFQTKICKNPRFITKKILKLDAISFS